MSVCNWPTCLANGKTSGRGNAREARQASRMIRLLTASILSSLNSKNLGVFAEMVAGEARQADPPLQLMRDLLATASGLEDASALSGLLRIVTKTEGDRYKPWQLAAAAGVLDSFDAAGEELGEVPPDIRQPVVPVVAFARQTEREGRCVGSRPLSRRMPLLGRDPRAGCGPEAARRVCSVPRARPRCNRQPSRRSLEPGPTMPPRPCSWRGPEPRPRYEPQMLDAILGRAAWQWTLADGHREGHDRAGPDRRGTPSAALELGRQAGQVRRPKSCSRAARMPIARR